MDQIFAGEGTGVGSVPLCKMQTGLLASYSKLLWNSAECFSCPPTITDLKRQPNHTEWKRCRLARGIWPKTGQKGN